MIMCMKHLQASELEDSKVEEVGVSPRSGDMAEGNGGGALLMESNDVITRIMV